MSISRLALMSLLVLSIFATAPLNLGCRKEVKVRVEGKADDLVDLSQDFGPIYFKRMIDLDKVAQISYEAKGIASKRWQTAIEAARTADRPIPILKDIIGKKTGLIVVDMQRAFLDEGAAIEVAEGRAIVPNINRLADNIRNKGGRIIFLRYLVNDDVGMLKYFEARSYLSRDRESPMKALRQGDPQFELYPDLDVKKSDIVMNKTRYSAVLGSAIVDTLKKYGIENAIVVGVTTDVCAGNTAESLMQKDFHVVMVWDGTAALDRLEHELYLARIFGLYGDVMPTEEVLMRLK